MLLAGDIGGTKTHLAIVSPEIGPRAPLAEATYPSARCRSLEAAVREFRDQVNVRVERASFGVAGPMVAGRATATNLPWVIDGGGIPPRILPTLRGERFLNAFRNRGRMSALVAAVPVHVILNPKVALLGAAYHGLKS